MMSINKIQDLIALIDELVREPGNWREKYQRVIDEADDHDLTSIYEFMSWFEEKE